MKSLHWIREKAAFTKKLLHQRTWVTWLMSLESSQGKPSLHFSQLFDQFIVKLRFEFGFLLNFTINQAVGHDFDSIWKRNCFVGNSVQRIINFSNWLFLKLFQIEFFVRFASQIFLCWTVFKIFSITRQPISTKLFFFRYKL